MDRNSGNSGLLPKAIALYQAGNLNKAETLCQNILAADPRNSEAVTLLGTIRFQRGDQERGLRLIQQSLAINPNQPGALCILGIALYRSNRNAEALACLDRAVALNPGQAELHIYRGSMLNGLQRHDEALASFDRAIALNPNLAEAYNNRGNTFGNLRRHDEALASYERAIAINPRLAEAYNNRGNTLGTLKRYDEALASYDQAIALNPGHAEFHNNRGNMLNCLQRHIEALASFDSAIMSNPRFAQAFNNRGNVLNELKRYDEALASYERAIALNPTDAKAYNNSGNTLSTLKRYDEALASNERAIALNPHDANAYSNRGNTLYRLTRYDEALASFDRAIALNPNLAEAYNNRGNALSILKRYDEALTSYERAIALNPDDADSNLNKAYLKIRLGDYEDGWKLHEWRWKHPDATKKPRRFPKPLWLGQESLEGRTILLYSEQGFGDFIQFCRYASMVEALGAKVVLQTYPSLVSLIATLKDSIRVIAIGGALPEFDYHCPLMSLPLAFRTTVNTVPATVPYLRTDPLKLQQWQNRLRIKTRPRIGLAWSGSKDHQNDHNRSISLNLLAPLINLDVEFHCLQTEIRPADREFLNAHPQIKLHESELNDFSDTAALVSEMSVVVSVDTSVVHLAGALGKPVWVLLPFASDYRWLTGGETSPWYPTARLFRQTRIGDWSTVVSKVAAELQQFRAIDFPVSERQPAGEQAD